MINGSVLNFYKNVISIEFLIVSKMFDIDLSINVHILFCYLIESIRIPFNWIPFNNQKLDFFSVIRNLDILFFNYY